MINAPEFIVRLSRHQVYEILRATPGIVIPVTQRCERADVQSVLAKWRQWPLLIRPVDSHAGHDLEKVDSPASLTPYLAGNTAEAFYLSPFIDYRSIDGLFRKYRIVLIAGKPLLCHLAISEHWMIHYLNAGMSESASKRTEEATSMASFDQGFAQRHARALAIITDRFGLDYLGIDCAETATGELLIFEVDSCMIVHAMDPVDLFPYKQAQMQKVFSCFRGMLHQKAKM